MSKIVRISEEKLINIINKAISEQKKRQEYERDMIEFDNIIESFLNEQENGGPDPEILSSLEDMGFAKKYCKNYTVNSEKLSYEYCHKTNPHLIISYPNPYNVLEILDTKALKIVDKFVNPNAVDIEYTIKSYLPQQYNSEND